jgi:hypothetical protein
MLPIPQTIMPSQMVDDYWIMDWKECVRKRLGPDLRYSPGLCQDGLRKNSRNCTQDSESLGLRFETGTSRMRTNNITHSTLKFGGFLSRSSEYWFAFVKTGFELGTATGTSHASVTCVRLIVSSNSERHGGQKKLIPVASLNSHHDAYVILLRSF